MNRGKARLEQRSASQDTWPPGPVHLIRGANAHRKEARVLSAVL